MDVIALCWDASSLGIALFQQPPRISTALWNLGCSVPTLVNLQSQEEARASAHSVMLHALITSRLTWKNCMCLFFEVNASYEADDEPFDVPALSV